MNKSIWSENFKMNNFPSLNNDISTEVLIVGGGITGILCAHELKTRNIECVIVEKDRIGMDITKNTTAFLTCQHELLYQELIKDYGLSKAKEYYEINSLAIKKYKELSEKYDIDFEEVSSIIYTNENEHIINNEKEAYDKIGIESKLIRELPDELNELGLKIKKGLELPCQGMINPLKCINELSKNLTIYEKTKVSKIKLNTAYIYTGTRYITIKFKKIIIATHYPFINLFGMYNLKLHQRLSYVTAFKYPDLSKTKTGNVITCSIDDNGMYIRRYNDYLIVGGNDRDHDSRGCIKDFVERVNYMLKDKDTKIEYAWSNQDVITLDMIPYIGRYDMLHKNRFVATGFNMWGFTWAIASSLILADIIEGKYNQYEIINPQRFWINKQLFKNMGTTIKNICKFKTPRCTHMGSSLNYNSNEKTWECPCHGSRFDNRGYVVNGPAKRKIFK